MDVRGRSRFETNDNHPPIITDDEGVDITSYVPAVAAEAERPLGVLNDAQLTKVWA